MAKDVLARGARTANFGSMSHISQDKWDSIFEPESETEKKPRELRIPINIKLDDAATQRLKDHLNGK